MAMNLKNKNLQHKQRKSTLTANSTPTERAGKQPGRASAAPAPEGEQAPRKSPARR